MPWANCKIAELPTMPFVMSEYQPLFELFSQILFALEIWRVARRISFLKRFSWENGNKTSLMTFESRKLFAFRHHVAQIGKIISSKCGTHFLCCLFAYTVRRRANCTICLFTFICDWQEFFVVEDFTTSRKFLVVFKLSIINSLRSFLADKEFSRLET